MFFGLSLDKLYLRVMKMKTVSKHLVIVGFSSVMCGSVASADSVTIRGGLSSGFANEYIFALESPDNSTQEADYGTGGIVSLTYERDSFMGAYGLELNAQFGVLSGDGSYSGLEVGDCQTRTFIGNEDDCIDDADSENTTTFAEVSALASFTLGSDGTTLLAGLSYLDFQDEIDVDYLYPSGISYYAVRNTQFSGIGVKAGARHEVPLGNTVTLGLEGMLGLYTGDRTTDTGTSTDPDTAPTLIEASTSTQVFTVELTPSVKFEADWITSGATAEVGLSYKLLSGVTDTRNTIFQNGIPAGDLGEENDAVSFTSLFAGVTIPLN